MIDLRYDTLSVSEQIRIDSIHRKILNGDHCSDEEIEDYHLAYEPINKDSEDD